MEYFILGQCRYSFRKITEFRAHVAEIATRRYQFLNKKKMFCWFGAFSQQCSVMRKHLFNSQNGRAIHNCEALCDVSSGFTRHYVTINVDHKWLFTPNCYQFNSICIQCYEILNLSLASYSTYTRAEY